MKNSTILFEDLVRFLDGFKALNERLGFNVFQGNKYVNIIDDSNPSDIPIRGKSRNHSVNEALKMIYEKINLPSIFVTSGWNSASKYSQQSSDELAGMIEKNPDFVKSVEVSINPFSGIMEKSREALRENNQSRAEFFRNVYTDRMANALKVFLKLFGTGKASIIYRHAPDYKGNELVGESETRRLYEEIYSKLEKMTGSALENIPYLRPENLTSFDKSHLIESSGRGRRFFPQDRNLKEQQELIDEALELEMMSPDERSKELGLTPSDRDGAYMKETAFGTFLYVWDPETEEFKEFPAGEEGDEECDFTTSGNVIDRTNDKAVEADAKIALQEAGLNVVPGEPFIAEKDGTYYEYNKETGKFEEMKE